MKLKLFQSCTQQPKTMSFRAVTTTVKEEDIYKIINSVYFNPDDDSVETPEPWFTNSSESASTIAEPDDSSMEPQLEEIIRGAQQSADQRLFFEPVGETSSILSDHDSPKQYADKNVRNLDVDHQKHFKETLLKDYPKLHLNLQKQFGDMVLEDYPKLQQTDQDVHNLIPNHQKCFKEIVLKDFPKHHPYHQKGLGEVVLEDYPKMWRDRDVHSLIPNRKTRKGVQKRISVFPPPPPPPPQPLKASVTMAVDSEDPYEDFKRSMEEMMESLGVRGQNHDWEALEGLLGWYLKANHKSNHGYIVGAFVDLLVGIVTEDNEQIIQVKSTTSFSSAASSLSSSASSPAQLLEMD